MRNANSYLPDFSSLALTVLVVGDASDERPRADAGALNCSHDRVEAHVDTANAVLRGEAVTDLKGLSIFPS